jgi:hypothetical protein
LAQNASVVGCTLNKPLSGPCEGWIAEIAFPLAAISLNNSNTLPPPEGSYWRINFSRVEWKVRRRKPNASPLHCHVVVKHNNLSRQARDKHMETLKKRGRSPCGAQVHAVGDRYQLDGPANCSWPSPHGCGPQNSGDNWVWAVRASQVESC